MSLVRYLTPLLVVGAVVAACGDDDTTSLTVPGSASSSSGRTSSGNSSGSTTGNPGSASSSSSSGNIDFDSLLTMKITSDYCNRGPGVCYDGVTYAVDFVYSKLTSTTCVELGGNPDSGTGGTEDAKTTKDLSADSITAIKKRLAEMKTVKNSPDNLYDAAAPNFGPLKSVEITTKSGGTVTYVAPSGSCNQSYFGNGSVADDGWSNVWSFLGSL